ncbi:Rrf2 family transcriptional regulator [Lactobacillus jensenii]|uniref:Rrf2 family transcriptional regulator n=1 Tax=Lactobacillus jensenii TaxID=109790 RepID=UPI0012493801|nr:Rrf2 family transcriptional regulator [Lactobacillus jensenii]KAA9320347.1 Rrf2 family transcriptional regulator [Lactobacillus jensenii]
MKYSYKFSDAIHLLSYLEIFKNEDLSSRAIAASIESNPSIIRQLISDLRSAVLIETRQGKASARLIRKPSDITLFDIYMAIDIDHELLHVDPKTNLNCSVGRNVQTSLVGFYEEIQNSAFEQMKKITLQDVISDLLARDTSIN